MSKTDAINIKIINVIFTFFIHTVASKSTLTLVAYFYSD